MKKKSFKSSLLLLSIIKLGIYSVVCLMLSLFVFSCKKEQPKVMYQMINTGFTAGGKCKVIKGPNTGKTGTYDSEGSCCDEGRNGWGCTDCKTNGTDNGKCVDAKRGIVPDFYIDSTRIAILETTVELPSGELIHNVTFVEAETGKIVKNICHPLYVISYSDMQKSKSMTDGSIVSSIQRDMQNLKDEIKNGMK